jgi:hypothetical protein
MAYHGFSIVDLIYRLFYVTFLHLCPSQSHICAFFNSMDEEHSSGLSSWSNRAMIRRLRSARSR